MGGRGPIPSRSEDLARDRSRKGGNRPPVTRGTLRPVIIPEPDPEWHSIAKMLWQSMIDSGQADFFQSSDWAFAYSVMEDITRYKEPQFDRAGKPYFKRSGQMLATIYAALGTLLVTEGDRRRASIELSSPESEGDDEADAVMDEYEEGLGSNVIQFPTTG